MGRSPAPALQWIVDSEPKQSWIVRGLFSPFLVGGLATAIFCQIAFLLPYQETLNFLFFSHPIAWVELYLFWVGMVALGQRLKRLGCEQDALEADLAKDTTSVQPLDAADEITERIVQLPGRLQTTLATRRLAAMCEYVRGHKSTGGLASHLEYLAGFAGEQLHNSFGLIRTVTWAVPILGFLGTVVGITDAIQNLDPAKLDTAFNLVAKGLGVAFGTTAEALGMSLVLVFVAYVIEKAERRILADVETKSIRWMTQFFPQEPAAGSPLLQAESEAARHLLAQTEGLVKRQAQLWQDSLEDMRQRWAKTLEYQQAELTESLLSGVRQTLDGHADQLASARKILLDALETVGRQISEQVTSANAVHQERSAQLIHQSAHIWQAMRQDFETSKAQQNLGSEQLRNALQEVTAAWSRQLQLYSDAAAAQTDSQQQVAAAWERLAGSHQQLAALQRQLAENLQAVQATENFNETLHSLSAAVHLLTARAKAYAA